MSSGNELAQPDETDEDEGAEEAATEASPKKSRKKLVAIAAAVLVVIGGAGGGAWYFLQSEPRQELTVPPAEALVDVTPLTVNLRGSNGTSQFLKVHLMLVPGEKSQEEITARLPLIIDAYQPFLRELRPEDLAGSAATFRLKEEMLVRANAIAGPNAVRDVLIQDLIQQ